MSKRMFTKEQIDAMLKNKHILYCSERSMTYTKDFKLLAIRLYEQGLASSEIFRDAGFDVEWTPYTRQGFSFCHIIKTYGKTYRQCL